MESRAHWPWGEGLSFLAQVAYWPPQEPLANPARD